MTTSIKATADGLSGELQVNGNPAFRFGADTSGQLAGFRNKIINGAFQVWQRSTTQSTAGYGSADRWFFGGSGFTVARGQDVQPALPPVQVTGEYCLITGTGAVGGYLQQPIENVRTFANTTCVLSYYYTQLSGTDTGGAPYLRQYFGSSGSASVDTSATSDTTVNVTGGIFKRTMVFTLPSVSGKTIAGGNDALVVIIPFGGTFQKAYFGIQLEAGSIATPFEHRPYGVELALCQRYFVNGLTPDGVGLGANMIARASCRLPVKMRASPSIQFQAGCQWFNGAASLTIATQGSNYSTVDRFQCDLNITGGGTSGYACMFANGTGDVSASAEL